MEYIYIFKTILLYDVTQKGQNSHSYRTITMKKSFFCKKVIQTLLSYEKKCNFAASKVTTEDKVSFSLI